MLRMKDIRSLLLVLFLALINGLVFTFLVPPWQHYDEPNHFEYVWLAANLDHLPSSKDYDPKLSRQVIKSMIGSGFFDPMSPKPIIDLTEKVKIPGYNQLKEPPLYYMFASLPVRLLGSRGINAKLYSARLVSLLFYLLTVLIAWGIAREISPSNHPIRWMLPLTIALLPGFADLMTSVNNDVLAVTVFSLFLWGSVRLIKNGFSLTDLMWVIGTAILAFFSKNTALVAWLLFPLVLLLTVFRDRLRWLAWSLFFGSLVVGLALCISLEDAAFWYRATSQIESTRLADDKAVLGDYVLQLDSQAEVTPSWSPPLFQPLPIIIGQRLRGQTITLGAWVWTTSPSEIPTPSINTSGFSKYQFVQGNRSPSFFAMQVRLPEDATRIWLSFPNFSEDAEGWIFYDGLVLAEGKYPVDQIPSFSTPEGSKGEWGGQSFDNLLQNPSFELAGPRIIRLVDDFSTRILPDHSRLSLILTSIIDWKGAGSLYLISTRHVFQTFWARFGWGHVPLIGEDFSYRLIVGFTLVALIGCLVGLIWRKKWIPSSERIDGTIIGLMGFGLLTSLGITLLRQANSFGLQYLYVPVARHSYPLIIPAVLFLCLGWLVVFYSLNYLSQRWKRREKDDEIPSTLIINYISKYQQIFYCFVLIVLDLVSIASIAHYYDMLV